MAEENPSEYLDRLGRQPRVGKRPRDDAHFGPESKRIAVAEEDGNWPCAECGNVNYPRRRECNKCQTARGPEGDRIVHEYVEEVKRMEEAKSKGVPYEPSAKFAKQKRRPRPAAVIVPAMQYEVMRAPPPEVYGGGGGAYPRPNMHVARETADALVGRFEAMQHASPVMAAMDVLAKAMEILTEDQLRFAGPQFVAAPGYGAPVGGHHPPPPPMAPYPAPHQNHLQHPPANHSRNRPQPANIRVEDFANPSDYLRQYGDPLARRGGTQGRLPMNISDGNWRCEGCDNVNFPRRSSCNKCSKARGPDGDRLVAEYVFHIINERRLGNLV